ncbi:MAG: hypothetical protein NC489_23075 [Ruminococcus flavefaciens]|nr:hypothetical protein [Ruminococcus flavefaciens]
MYSIKNAIYVQSVKGYNKCVLHKQQVDGRTVYHLVETKINLPELPKDFSVLTLPEIIAKYGRDAVDDDATVKEATEE